jgi:hypothetical protein
MKWNEIGYGTPIRCKCFSRCMIRVMMLAQFRSTGHGTNPEPRARRCCYLVNVWIQNPGVGAGGGGAEGPGTDGTAGKPPVLGHGAGGGITDPGGSGVTGPAGRGTTGAFSIGSGGWQTPPEGKTFGSGRSCPGFIQSNRSAAGTLLQPPSSRHKNAAVRFISPVSENGEEFITFSGRTGGLPEKVRLAGKLGKAWSVVSSS